MLDYDVVGIGAGPANLSAAALLSKLPQVKAIFIEKDKNFCWHPGMLLPDVSLQVSYLKDLVTLVDPTNAYSFLNYLLAKGSLYQFITADFKKISRQEYNDYLKWVFNSLASIKNATTVNQVNYDGSNFIVENSTNDSFVTKNIILGTGRVPRVPKLFTNAIGEHIFHSSEFAFKNKDFKNKRVAVIGGGQSGAEIFAWLIKQNISLPQHVYWISRRSNFLPMDDSPFINEVFTPTYLNHFYSLNDQEKLHELNIHNLASDGISMYTLQEIYQRLYYMNYVEQSKVKVSLLPNNELVDLVKLENTYNISLKGKDNKVLQKNVDYIILCTGYEYRQPVCIEPIAHLIEKDQSGFIVNKDYSLNFINASGCKIYIQNGSKHTHGIADPNLSLLSYRSAVIINAIAKKNIYKNIAGNFFLKDQH